MKSDVVRHIEELRALERAHPQLITPDSPTQQVGDLASRAFDKVRHSMPMLSLANALTSEDVTDFVRRIRRFFEARRLREAAR